MPVISIRIPEDLFKELKKKHPDHGELSRLVRNHLKASLNGVEVDKRGQVSKTLGVPVILMASNMFGTLLETQKDLSILIDAVTQDSCNHLSTLGTFSWCKLATFLQLLNNYNWYQGQFSETDQEFSCKVEHTIFSEAQLRSFLIKIVESFANKTKANLRVQWDGLHQDGLPTFVVSKHQS